MKLFTFATSPYARKVRIVLDYKGITYEPIERCYSLDRKEDLRAASIRAEVPVLVLDDGRTIADSTIICEYLEQVYPQPAVFPVDPYQRVRMRRIEDYATGPSTRSASAISLASCARMLPKLSQLRAPHERMQGITRRARTRVGSRRRLLLRRDRPRRFRRDLSRSDLARDGNRTRRPPTAGGVERSDEARTSGRG